MNTTLGLVFLAILFIGAVALFGIARFLMPIVRNMNSVHNLAFLTFYWEILAI